MTLYTIPGMTEETILKTDTAPSGGGLRPFPCDAQGWTTQTGFVVKAEVKTFTNADGENTNLSIVVANNEYGGEILINLDPRKVPPGTKDVEKQMQQNLDDIRKIVKILGCHTNGKFDTDKLKNAKGNLTFICKHKGFNEKDGRHYHKISYIFKGEAPDPLPQPNEKPQLPALPGSALPAAAPTSGADPFGDSLF